MACHVGLGLGILRLRLWLAPREREDVDAAILCAATLGLKLELLLLAPRLSLLRPDDARLAQHVAAEAMRHERIALCHREG